ncbi:TrgA family protein [uncultured Roseovarius sp.]|uniref:TrgA family protein n=1 Tax=uncultured Roseovarius sp. TaxID=293344 RepID=UPI002636DC3B|nr:TrgA family protein [uncultured Roseovarius sp.]
MPITDKMPTAAKMAAAICLGAVAWYASEIIRPLMPDGTDFGWFNYVNLVLGLLCGWFVVGTRVGRSYVESFSAGLTGMAALVFWALFLQSFNEMLKLALQRRYEGPVEAIVAIFEIGVDFGSSLLDAKLIFVLLVGGIVAGVMAEWASRRWS